MYKGCAKAVQQNMNKDIFIKDNHDIEDVELWDCRNICIINCRRISRLPPMIDFTLLESLTLTHIKIPICNMYFPDCLRSLRITYCQMKQFVPQYLGNNVTEVDLSFNSLAEIPRCLEGLLIANPTVRISLRNNDLWFDMYTSLSPAMISEETMEELILANKLNLIGLDKLREARRILAYKRMGRGMMILDDHINDRLADLRENLPTTHNDPQNVHLTSVQTSFKESLQVVMSRGTRSKLSLTNVIRLFDDHSCIQIMRMESQLQQYIRMQSTNIDVIEGYTFNDVLTKVCSIIMDEEDIEKRQTMLDILKDELEQGMNLCFTGKITRMVNSLNVFVDGINVSISKTEELSNSIVALRRKFAIMYKDADEYIAEAIPAVWQLLEDMCVPPHEHMVWLEYV